MFLCGDLGPHCAAENCAASTAYLCDYPVGDDKTCDLSLCNSHAYEVAPNIHYCPGHLVLWQWYQMRTALSETPRIDDLVRNLADWQAIERAMREDEETRR